MIPNNDIYRNKFYGKISQSAKMWRLKVVLRYQFMHLGSKWAHNTDNLQSRCFFLGPITSSVVALHTTLANPWPAMLCLAAVMRSKMLCFDMVAYECDSNNPSLFSGQNDPVPARKLFLTVRERGGYADQYSKMAIMNNIKCHVTGPFIFITRCLFAFQRVYKNIIYMIDLV